METLPSEILIQIFANIELISSDFVNGPSYFGKLFCCSDCIAFLKCQHLHPSEIPAAYTIRLVCKQWDDLIRTHFGSYQFWIQKI